MMWSSYFGRSSLMDSKEIRLVIFRVLYKFLWNLEIYTIFWDLFKQKDFGKGKTYEQYMPKLAHSYTALAQSSGKIRPGRPTPSVWSGCVLSRSRRLGRMRGAHSARLTDGRNAWQGPVGHGLEVRSSPRGSVCNIPATPGLAIVTSDSYLGS
jgi:hypothetical protein